jgi:hypothetical protein
VLQKVARPRRLRHLLFDNPRRFGGRIPEMPESSVVGLS